MHLPELAEHLGISVDEAAAWLDRAVKAKTLAAAFRYDGLLGDRWPPMLINALWRSRTRAHAVFRFRLLQYLAYRNTFVETALWKVLAADGRPYPRGFVRQVRALTATPSKDGLNPRLWLLMGSASLLRLLIDRVSWKLERNFGSLISPYADIAAGFFDGSLNVQIASGSAIGRNVTMGPRVTLAAQAGSPTIEDDVNVWTGALIAGAVTVGRGATVGGNSVVVRNVRPGETVMGVPAGTIFQKRRAESPEEPS